MIRFVLLCLVAILLIWCGTRVKLGQYSCLGHVRRIWNSEETRDFKQGIRDKATSESTREFVQEVREKAGPVVDRVKRGVEAGLKEAVKSKPEREDEDPAEAAEGDGTNPRTARAPVFQP